MISDLAKIIKEEFQRYNVVGTAVEGLSFGDHPMREAPWYLVDMSTAEDEVNYPGEFVSEHETASEAHDARWELIAAKVATLDIGVIRDGNDG